MIFKCWTCNKYKFWNDKCGEVHLTSSTDEVISTKKICSSCFDEVDSVYERGKETND